jgi:hypothetical protein
MRIKKETMIRDEIMGQTEIELWSTWPMPCTSHKVQGVLAYVSQPQGFSCSSSALSKRRGNVHGHDIIITMGMTHQHNILPLWN